MAFIFSAVNSFITYQENIKCHSPQTLKWYVIPLKQLVDHAGIEELHQITPEVIYKFIAWGKDEKKWSPHSQRTKLSAIKAFFNWAVKNKIVKETPFPMVELPKLPIHVKEVLSVGQANTILNCIKSHKGYSHFQRERNYTVISVFLHTGLRRNELINLDIQDIVLNQDLLQVRKGKGSKDRVISINQQLAGVLEHYLQERQSLELTTPALFPKLSSDERITEESIRRLTQTIRNQTGIFFTPHTLRRTFATMMLEGGCDIFTLKNLMGHEDIQTLVTNYLKLSSHMMKQQVNKHPLVCPF